MKNRLVMTRPQRQIPHDGSDTELISAHHETDNDYDEPLVRCGSGEAISKSRRNLIHKFQHGMVDRKDIG